MTTGKKAVPPKLVTVIACLCVQPVNNLTYKKVPDKVNSYKKEWMWYAFMYRN